MIIEEFDYQEFSENIAKQARKYIPADLSESDKTYIINIILNHCNLAGEALNQDEEINISADRASIICQFIGEWAFHKAIDLIRSNVPMRLRDEVLEKVSFTAYEIAKLSIAKNIPMQQMIMLVGVVSRCTPKNQNYSLLMTNKQRTDAETSSA